MAVSIYPIVLLVVQLAALSSTTNCPVSCECSSWLGTYVACRGTNLSVVPMNTFVADLESLYFTYNKNVRELMGNTFEVNQYAPLRVLILNNNMISNIANNAFQGMDNVKQLDLSGNQITTIPPDVFPTLPRLRRLNLFNNPHIELPEDGFNLPKLKLLNLRGCNLENIPLNFFTNMPKLLYIKLDRNKFSTIDSRVFHPVNSNLKFLDLSINKFTSLPRGLLEDLPATIELHLEYNRFQCDCVFQRDYSFYETRSKQPRLSCAAPKKMRGKYGSEVKDLLNCEEDLSSPFMHLKKKEY